MLINVIFFVNILFTVHAFTSRMWKVFLCIRLFFPFPRKKIKMLPNCTEDIPSTSLQGTIQEETVKLLRYSTKYTSCK